MLLVFILFRKIIDLAYLYFSVLFDLYRRTTSIDMHECLPSLNGKLKIIYVFNQMIKSFAHNAIRQVCIINFLRTIILMTVEEAHPSIEPFF
jgi:hypothetical protein